MYGKAKWLWNNWGKKNKPPYVPTLSAREIKLVQNFLTTNKNGTMPEQNLAPKLINANLDVIEEEVLSKLPEQTYKIAKAASDALGETGVALFDGNPADGEQIEKIWRQYTNVHLVDFATQKAINETEKIASDILRNLTQLLIDPSSQSLKALTDEITDDGAQLKAAWIDFLREGNNLTVLLDNTLKPLLELIKIINPSLVTLLVRLAEDQLRNALEEE